MSHGMLEKIVAISDERSTGKLTFMEYAQALEAYGCRGEEIPEKQISF